MLLVAILAPLAGFLFLFSLGKKFSVNVQGYFACFSIFLSFFIFCYLFLQFHLTKTPVDINIFSWLNLKGLDITFGLLLDKLSFIMIIIITGIGFLIHFYSIGYMQEEKSSYRYFSFLSLFIFFMLLLVTANNLVLLFLGWEGVGLCSYLLIGFYLEKPVASAAAKKAFLVNRIGDFFLMIALMLIFFLFGTFHFASIKAQLEINVFDQNLVLITTLMLFLSATGKSAQIPLHIWLPDAMEAPTPVSALIHAATMVTAGIYLIARLHFLFVLAPTTIFIILIFGSLTALLGASIAIVQTDIKKILAYSTISQLGYMFMALGVGAFSTTIFHLLTHAFFKALLFLSAGALILVLHHEQDIRKMGQLKKKIPLIWFSFAIGSWSLAGLPLASGFFSKDEILLSVLQSYAPIFFGIGIFTAFLSAIYTYRMMNLVFYSNERKKHTIKKLPFSMSLVLKILIVGTIVCGFLGLPHFLKTIHLYNLLENYFQPFFSTITIAPQTKFFSFLENWTLLGKELFVLTLSLCVSFLGLFFMFSKFHSKEWNLEKKPNFIYRFLAKKYYIETIYSYILLRPLQIISLRIFNNWSEKKLIRSSLQILRYCAVYTGELISTWHNGKLFRYTLTMLLGIVIMLYLFLF